jgi:1,3,6,8-tetrahydroxynaphthalene synthase
MSGAKGLVAGFGPGITAEMALGRWSVDLPGNELHQRGGR